MSPNLPVEIEKDLKSMPLFANVSSLRLRRLVSAISTGKSPPDENWTACYRTVNAGEVICQQGTYSSDFWVLRRGIVRAYRTEADGSVHLLATIGSDDPVNWCGEMPALSNQPQYAKLVSETVCLFLVIEGPGFKKLYEDRSQDPGNKAPTFKDLVDGAYRERALENHLRAAPLLASLSATALQSLSSEAQLVTYEKDSVIAEQGAEANAVYLVRSGIVKCVVRSDGRERFHAALCANSSFGERALTEDRRWPASYSALTRVDAVRLPRAAFEKLFRIDAGSRGDLSATATRLVEEESGYTSPAGRHLAKAADVLVIDLGRCTHCNACVESCVAVHEDGVPRISKRGLVSDRGTELLTTACYHCQSPDCMMSCNFGAIRRTLAGEIEFIYDACTGCKCCERSCPYGVIRMVDVLGVAPGAAPGDAPAGRPGLSRALRSIFKDVPVLGRFLGTAARVEAPSVVRAEGPEEKPRQKAIKCDFCAGMPFEACVYNCPWNAIRRADPIELERMEKWPRS